MRRFTLIAGAMALAATSAARGAEEAPICAARPGKSTAPCTVPAGRFQLETGLVDWSVQKVPGERDTALTIGETVFKYGLTERSDIELDVTPWQRFSSRVGAIHSSASGFGDLVVSYKQQLASSDSPVQFALLPYVKIPTANHSVGNRKWEGGVLLPVGYAIPRTPLSLTLTPELDWSADGDGHGHHASMAQVASLGWSMSPRLTLSGELWGQWNWDPAGTVRQYSADASIAYLASQAVQLDAGANVGLNSQTPDVEVYTGVSVRF